MSLFEYVARWFDAPSTWLLLGLALLALEVFVPGTFFLWFGVSALAIGAVLLVVAVEWKIALVAWAVLAVLLLLVGRRFFHARDREVEDPYLNERAARYTGRQFTLTEPLIESQGNLKIDDTIWRVSGPDLPAGTRIRVVGVDGPVLKVDRA
ncbi:NfeD family protein [Prosthecomicrobium sp. N25]|uniref:NfeD family protein n=1 Tax=Prosthecomicrobium sp. N25 TaxID=3129254 RepID=UPI0030772A20